MAAHDGWHRRRCPHCEALIPLESWDADCCPECHAPVATLETPRHPTVPITREA